MARGNMDQKGQRQRSVEGPGGGLLPTLEGRSIGTKGTKFPLTRRLPGLFCTLRVPKGGRSDPPPRNRPDVNRFLPSMAHSVGLNVL